MADNLNTRVHQGMVLIGHLEDLYGNGDAVDNLVDGLTDLLHAKAAYANELITALNTAINHYAAETNGDEETDEQEA